MKPASSVLLLTTLTGAGYGLLVWLGILDLAGAVPHAPAFGIVAILIGLAFAGGGLIASMAHLGRPERAWRAFSQWRSSWLSREGVASTLSFPPALGFAALWFFEGATAPATRILAALSLVMALVTVGCTAMIYASLIPIRQWHNRHTLPDYLIFSLFSGAVLLTAIMGVWQGHVILPGSIAAASGLAAIAAKSAYWRFIDRQKPLATLASATSVRQFGAVRPLDQPHFSENYILREMGFTIARKHAEKLRRIALAAGFIAPTILALVATLGLAAWLSGPLAALLALAGLFIERWLFFAEATHVSAIYYGRPV
ncbi:MAG TPA: DmsC/YnfH family molybdoenzyme membrane anchor subunit [Acetobacteraceae bacterium]|nr:DmsC/YnfH family molybdoenzyme membrane anchor subunit [Acetobacteraceae bacterium]